MNNKIKTMVAAAFAAVVFNGIAGASPVYDTSLVSPGVYFGSGNGGTNVGWTVNTDGSVELGLATINRGVGAVLPTSTNIYNVPTGPDASLTHAWWNFDLSVNLRAGGTGTLTLGDVTPTLTIQDYLHGTSLTFNPFFTFNDNSAFDGTNTRNGNDVAHGGTGLPATIADVGFQNSENLIFFPGLGFDMNANDTFLITLSLLNNSDSSSLGSVSEFVVVGKGAPTPLPAAAPLFVSGLAGFGWLVRRRKKKLAA